MFGFDPFSILGLNEPRQQNFNQGNQGGFLDQFANILNNGFMHPVPPPNNRHPPNNRQNNQPEPRPKYFRPNKPQ